MREYIEILRPHLRDLMNGEGVDLNMTEEILSEAGIVRPDLNLAERTLALLLGGI